VPSSSNIIVVDTHKRAHHSLLIVAIVFALFSFPLPHAHAGSSFSEKLKAIFLGNNDATDTPDPVTSQTIPLFKPMIVAETIATGGTDQDSSDVLQATSGPLRVSTENIDFPTTDTISVYEVKKGDTLASVAKIFGVSKNTITWANDLKSEFISPGDTLVILPMTGIKHTVKNGDTVASIAKKYKADADDIAKFNGISKDADLEAGDTVLVPEGELAVTTTTKTKKGTIIVKEKLLDTYTYQAPDGFLIRPIVGGRKTQGLHGHNGIDFGAAPGTSVLASGSGRVILAKMGGYNGGYGNMIIISHDGGIQTVYAHLKQINVLSGQAVSQGQIIGQVGNTGRSTGPHLHFEVRGAVNPF
jgi:murein DD-endopeptidase MepM/ murein hydrolase activator NlpD